MQRITPTGWGKATGTPVRQLGSTKAVLAAMGWEGVLIVANAGAGARATKIWTTEEPPEGEGGADRTRGAILRLVSATAGPNALYEIPETAVIGVDVDAFAGVPGEVWADMQRILARRFKTVHWG